jgi:hypothetical protein
MKRWRITCNHGCGNAPPPGGSTERWRDIGPMDSVKAILVSNE